MDYDQTDPKDIERYARLLVGKCLRDVLPAYAMMPGTSGQGKMGVVLENLYFGINPGNVPEPDFKDAGVELKSFPLKKLKNGWLVAKERVSLGMIDYHGIVLEIWSDSAFLRKNAHLLLMAYRYVPDSTVLDFLFRFATLWDFPSQDLKIIRDDWKRIAAKTRAGERTSFQEHDVPRCGHEIRDVREPDVLTIRDQSLRFARNST